MKNTVKTLPQRRGLNHEVPPWVQDAVFFITICCQHRNTNTLCHAETADRLFKSVALRQERGDWWVQLILLMPDHLHMLVSFPGDGDMRGVIREWKKYTSRMLSISWQRDFFDHRLRNDESLEEKAAYIRMNPVRRRLVERPEDWPYVWPR